MTTYVERLWPSGSSHLIQDHVTSGKKRGNHADDGLSRLDQLSRGGNDKMHEVSLFFKGIFLLIILLQIHKYCQQNTVYLCVLQH
jgi:hypothetical protein